MVESKAETWKVGGSSMVLEGSYKATRIWLDTEVSVYKISSK